MALGHEQLPPHDVDAGDLLGDGVLHLDPRIDLNEEELSRVGIDEKLHRAGVLVAGRAADGQRRLADRIPRLRGQVGGGGEFHHLLVPPLHRAVALEEVDEVAVQVAEQLHLDVPGPLDELLHEDGRRAEGRLAFPLRALEGHGEFVLAANHSHAAATTAVGRLEDHRPAEFLRDRERIGEARHRPGAAGEDRHARLPGEFAGGSLVAERFEQLDPRAYKRDARLHAGGGELGILREEAVAGMDAVDAVGLGERHDPLDVEVRANRLARLAREVGLVRLEAVERETVFMGVDSDGANAQFVRRPEDADGDFAAIGDEEFGDRPH